MSSSSSNYHFKTQKTILLHVKLGPKLLKTPLQEKPNLIEQFKRAKASLIKWTQLRLKSVPEKVCFYYHVWNCSVKSDSLFRTACFNEEQGEKRGFKTGDFVCNAS